MRHARHVLLLEKRSETFLPLNDDTEHAFAKIQNRKLQKSHSCYQFLKFEFLKLEINHEGPSEAI